jgi:cell volume regulation protein A
VDVANGVYRPHGPPEIGEPTMDAFSDFFPQLLIVFCLLAVALIAAPLAARIGLPAPAAFLGVGIVAGLWGIGPTDEIAALPLQEIGVVLLYLILFQGGLSTGLGAFRRNARPIVLLGLPGTAATAAGIALIGHAIGLDWELAILVGVALAPTDPAAVYGTLRGGGAHSDARTILEGESGFNDPVGITFMVVALAAIGPDGASFAEGAVELVRQLGFGVGGGVIGGLLLVRALRATPSLDNDVQAFALVAGAFIVGAATASVEGSGFLAVYITGLLLSDAWGQQDSRRHAVPAALGAAAEIALFAVLGTEFASLVEPRHLWQGVALTAATLLVVRPPIAFACLVRTRLTRAERVLVSWGGLKGAVPLLLAAYPALEALPEYGDSAAIVLVATAASIVVQGMTLGVVAARAAPRARNDDEAGIVPGHAKAGG